MVKMMRISLVSFVAFNMIEVLHITKILEKFSEAELQDFLEPSSFELAREIKKDKLIKKDLCYAVYLSQGIELILNDNYRDLLISKLSQEQLETIFNDINKDIPAKKRTHHSLKLIAKQYQVNFAKAVGLSEHYSNSKKLKTPTPDVTNINPIYKLYDYQITIANKALKILILSKEQ